MVKTKKKAKEEVRFRGKLVDEMLRLAASGFGLVAALSWNELIKKAISQYVEPIVGKDSGIISLLIYAIIVTVLAVAVTYNLAKIKEKL